MAEASIVVVILGLPGIGKHAFMNRYNFGNMKQSVDAVGDTELPVRHWVVNTSYSVELICPTSPPKPYFLSTPLLQLYHSAGTVIAYAVNSAVSFDYAQSVVASAVRHFAGAPGTGTSLAEVPILLLGLQSDDKLARQVAHQDAKGFAMSHGCAFGEASPNGGEGVVDAIRIIIDRVRNNEPPNEPEAKEDKVFRQQSTLFHWRQWVLSIQNDAKFQ